MSRKARNIGLLACRAYEQSDEAAVVALGDDVDYAMFHKLYARRGDHAPGAQVHPGCLHRHRQPIPRAASAAITGTAAAATSCTTSSHLNQRWGWPAFRSLVFEAEPGGGSRLGVLLLPFELV